MGDCAEESQGCPMLSSPVIKGAQAVQQAMMLTRNHQGRRIAFEMDLASVGAPDLSSEFSHLRARTARLRV